jgi:hypothetical protein
MPSNQGCEHVPIPHQFWGKLIALIGRRPVEPAARRRTEVVQARAGVIRIGDEPKPGTRRYSKLGRSGIDGAARDAKFQCERTIAQ